MTPQLNLLDLPVEILAEILIQLDHIHILRCSVVCKQLHALINTSLALQYRIELASDGLVNGQPGGPASTTAARMEILLERRAAWRALRPNRRTSVALAGHCHAYELVGGMFAKALEDFGAARRLVASWLPGNGRAEEMRFVVNDLGVRIKDFALDPSQDLIVLLEHRPAPGSSSMAGADICVHLRKLSAVVAPHPAAKTPVLCRRAVGPVHGCMIQVVEDVVGMYFWMPFHAVLIWNWTSGEELLFVQENQTPERIWDFSFLSSRAYMITTLKDGGEIHIYSFDDPSSDKQPMHVAKLRLPTPRDDRFLLELTTTTGPFLARPPPGVPFASAHNARVHVFTLHHDQATQRGRWQPACFVIHNQTLMQYVHAHRERKEAAGAVDVLWEEWGPHGTRFFVLAMGFQWLRYVHGTRVVCPVLQATGESRVEVLDFNVHASRAPTAAEKLAAARMGIDTGRPAEGARFVCEPSVFPAETVFANQVVTALPYYSMPAPGQCEPYVGYMIDEQRLLGLKASPFTDGDLGDVDVYTF